MDDFFERPELNGSLVSMEFGPGGRIQQIWVADPSYPEDHAEFEFVLPPVSLGEEISDDYNPGTILLGARTHPEEPWILSRNAEAEPLEEGDRMAPVFQYRFGLLPEIRATGRFYEVQEGLPQIVWDLSLKNVGRITIEIGELGFPFALNNLLDGYPRTDWGAESLFKERVHVHKFIGGAASYLFAQRLTADPPGLLITPGEGTSWEFVNHVPASLLTSYRWEGIPVVYVYSRAALEREGWSEWFNGHSSLVLEPGDERTFQTRFMAASRDRHDGVHQALTMTRRPAFRLFPAAVAPADVGITVEVEGAVPARFYGSEDAETETDADEYGGFCFIKPGEPGPFTLFMDDTDGRHSAAHLYFTAPIEELIRSRARWILEHQRRNAPGTNLDGAFVPVSTGTHEPLTDPEDYASSFAIESILSEALFLAEKNTIYPERAEVVALEEFVHRFVRQWLQNPGTGAVGSTFVDSSSAAVHQGRPLVYALLAAFYRAMGRIAKDVGTPSHDAGFYGCQAALTVQGFARHADPQAWRGVGVPLMPELLDAAEEARREGLLPEDSPIFRRREGLTRRRYPFASATSMWDPSVFADVHRAALEADSPALQDTTMSCAGAARSLAPAWWWYGSDKRFLDDSEGPFHPAMADKGEMCLGPTSPGNAPIFLQMLERDSLNASDTMVRLAYGGLLGVWALVRQDGSAAHGFCPEASSRQYGMSWVTGTTGLSLYHYLRNMASYVVPSRTNGVLTLGCHFEAQEDEEGVELVARPWDGVGRRIVIRQIGVEAEAKVGIIQELRVHSRKRRASVVLRNPGQFERRGSVTLRGLWGTLFQVNGKKEHIANGALSLEQPLPPGREARIDVKVIG